MAIAEDMALTTGVTVTYALASLEIREDVSRVHRLFELAIAGIFGYSTSRVTLRVAVEHLEGLAAAFVALPGGWTISNETILHTLVTLGFTMSASAPFVLFFGFRRVGFDFKEIPSATSRFAIWVRGKITPDGEESPGVWTRLKRAASKLVARVLVYAVLMALLVGSDVVTLPQDQLLTFGAVISLLISSSPVSLVAVPVAVLLTDILIG